MEKSDERAKVNAKGKERRGIKTCAHFDCMHAHLVWFVNNRTFGVKGSVNEDDGNGMLLIFALS